MAGGRRRGKRREPGHEMLTTSWDVVIVVVGWHGFPAAGVRTISAAALGNWGSSSAAGVGVVAGEAVVQLESRCGVHLRHGGVHGGRGGCGRVVVVGVAEMMRMVRVVVGVRSTAHQQVGQAAGGQTRSELVRGVTAGRRGARIERRVLEVGAGGLAGRVDL